MMRRIARLLSAFALISLSLFSISPSEATSTNPTPDCTAGTTCKVTFAFTGDYYIWSVPSGVTSITVELYGAQGGSGSSSGGYGGYVKGDLAVSSGTNVYVYVGGQNGYNGGGAAGTGGYTAYVGGGATDIRIGGNTYLDRKAVGGGGGGAGRSDCTSQGGGGGAYPGGLGGIGGNTQIGGDGTLTAGGSTTSSNGGNTCTSSSRGGGGGGQNGGGAAGGYGTATGGTAGGCGGTNSSPAGGASNSGAFGGCFGLGGGAGTSNNGGGGGGGGGWYGGGPGGGNWGSGGGGGSSYLGSMTSTSYTNATRTGNGIAYITYLNSPTPTTFSTSQISPTNISTASTISYSLVLSQSVSDLAVGDFQFGSTSTCNTPGLTGSGTTYTVTLTNCSEGELILQLKANSVTGNSTGPPTVSSANTVIIDRTAPQISSVSPPSIATYKPADTPTFTVAFNESVTVTGTPRLTLTVGSSTEYANFVSMSDSKTALFRYTVATDPLEFDTDGISVSTTLDLNSGTIRDLATNALSALTFSAPTLTSVLVAQPAAAPTIDSIAATSGTLTVYFTPGAARGSTTTNYQYSANGGAWTTRASGTTASPLVISSLTNGTGYAIRLRAVTNAGNSDSSTAVTETPTAVVVSGDTTLTLTYGNSASTGSYSATGGTGVYTWSLGSSISGVTLSTTTVTASNTLAAGTYTQTVRATDGNSQVGSRTLTITVNKASTSISIALPNSSSTAAAGGVVTITATVPRAGNVNFQLGGSTISGCGTASAASTTATCSWTAPGTLGNVTLTAVFTPTDSSNYETSTTTNLIISVVNGESTVSLSLAGNVTTVQKSKAIVITASVSQAGVITFLVDGKRIPGCYKLNVSGSTKMCTWKPSIQKFSTITATLNPTDPVYENSSDKLIVSVVRRTGNR